MLWDGSRLKQDTGDFFGTGMIVVDFRHVGTTAWLSEVLKISVRTSVSCAAQSFSTRPGMFQVSSFKFSSFICHIHDYTETV